MAFATLAAAGEGGGGQKGLLGVDWCGPEKSLRGDFCDEADWNSGDLCLGRHGRIDGDSSAGAVEHAESGGEL